MSQGSRVQVPPSASVNFFYESLRNKSIFKTIEYYFYSNKKKKSKKTIKQNHLIKKFINDICYNKYKQRLKKRIKQLLSFFLYFNIK